MKISLSQVLLFICIFLFLFVDLSKFLRKIKVLIKKLLSLYKTKK